MSKTYPELYFPPNPSNGDEYTQPNGITYVYNLEKETWELKIDSFATENFVYDEVSRRVSRYGDSMIGSLTLKQDAASTARRIGVLGFDLVDNNVNFRAYLKLDGKESLINFTDGTGSSYIQKGGLLYIGFHPNNLTFGRNVVLYPSVDSPLFTTKVGTQFLLHRVEENPLSNKTTIQSGVQIRTTPKSLFGILNTSGDSIFSFGGTGKMRAISDEPYATTFYRSSNPYGGPEDLSQSDARVVLRLNNKTFKLHTNKNYNLGLIAGYEGKKYEIKIPSGETEMIDYRDDALLSTIGYVKRSKFHPGESVCANSESDAEVGGLWRNGNSVYIRLS